ncbi:MAG: ion transporter, partial [Alphaproteobacteria bacterium]|nr:ion transporter [Alphaproteobacteria bacterium]
MEKLRRQTHDLLDFGLPHGWAGSLVNAFLIALIFANVVAVVLESIAWLHEDFGDYF